MPARLMRCIKAVKRQNRKRGTHYNPWAVCVKSTGLKPHKRR